MLTVADTGRTLAHAILVIDSLQKCKRQDTNNVVDQSTQDTTDQASVFALVVCQNSHQAKSVHSVYASVCRGTSVTLSHLESYPDRIAELRGSFAHIVILPIWFLDVIARWDQYNEDDHKDQARSKATREHADVVTLCRKFFSTVKTLVIVGTRLFGQSALEECLRDLRQDVIPMMPKAFSLISISPRHTFYHKMVADWGIPSSNDDHGKLCSIIDHDEHDDGVAPEWDLLPHVIVPRVTSSANETVAEALATSVHQYIKYSGLGIPLKQTILVCGDPKQTYEVAKCQGELDRRFARHNAIAHERQSDEQCVRSTKAFSSCKSRILITTLQTLHSFVMSIDLAADEIMFLDYPDGTDHLLDNMISAMLIAGRMGSPGTARFFFRTSARDSEVMSALMSRFEFAQLDGYDSELWAKEKAVLIRGTDGSGSVNVDEKPKMTETEAKYLFGFDETE